MNMDVYRFRSFALISILGVASPLLAQTNSALLIAPFPKEQLVHAEAGALFMEGGHIAESGVDEDFRLSMYGSVGMFRLNPGQLESPRIGYEFTYLDLDSSFSGLPDQLLDQSVAIGFPIAKYDEWILGASVGAGYAGDSFFGDGDAYYALASLAAFKQLDETSALVLVLDYDGNRTFLPDVPLPGAAYIKRLTDKLELTAGAPYSSIRWEATDQLTIELGFYIPEDLRLDIGYEFLPHWTAFGRVRQQRDAFFIDGLVENHDRILFEQRRAEAGIRYEPCKAFHADIALGYAWHGEFSQGFDSRDTDEIADISDEPYLRAGLELRY
jgi:hypothetical protein